MNSTALAALVAVAVMLAALAGAYRKGEVHARLVCEAQQAQAQRAAFARYQARVRELAQRDQALAALRTQTEIEHGKAMDEVARQRGINERLGRLRDPGRAGGCAGSAVPAATGPAGRSDDAAAGADLSAAATRFLFDFAERADRAAVYAGTCHRWLTGQPQ